MKLTTKTIIIIAAVLFFLLSGFRFLPWFHKPEPPPQATNPFVSFPPGFTPSLPPMTALSADPKINEIMTKYQLGPKAADYIAQAKLEILNQTDTSVHFLITYPDKTTTDETITITSDPKYTPSPGDLERSARTGSKVHGPTFAVKKSGQKEWQYTLQYHVPYSAMPGDLVQKLQHPSSNQTGRIDLPDLIPQVHADGGLGAGEGAVSIVANYFATYYEKMWEMSAKSVGVDVPLALMDLAEDSAQLKLWMDEMGKMQDCAQNPTNPLSQKVSQDSNYQRDVLDPLSAAKGDVASTLVPTLASDTANFVTHWLPFGSGAVVGLIFSTQDDAVSQYAEGRIEEARKYVVPCDDVPMSPGNLRPMDGTFTYAYMKKTADESETKTAEGKFPLNIVSGGLAGEGTAQFTHEESSKSMSPVPSCQGIAHSMKAKGDLKITAQGGGTPLGGVIELRVNGELPVVETQLVGNGGNKCVEQSKNNTTFYSFVCHFDHLDMVHGGTFSTFAEGENGRGTCTIDLSRK